MLRTMGFRIAITLLLTATTLIADRAIPRASAVSPRLSGVLLSAGIPLSRVSVTLYRSSTGAGHHAVAIGKTVSGRDGSFQFPYPSLEGTEAVLYVSAGSGGIVRLVTVLGRMPVPAHV